MKTKLLVLLLICSFSILVNAQNTVKDSIQILKTSQGYKYKVNNKILTPSEFTNLIQTNDLSNKYLKKAQISTNIMSVLGGVGGYFIGYPLGTMIGGGEPQWAMAAIGCGFIALALPVYSSVKKNIRKSVSAYNNDILLLGQNSNEYNLELGYNQNGFGLTLNF